MSTIAIREGQIWKEVRFPRYVRIIDAERPDQFVAIRTCDHDGEPTRRSQITRAQRERFNGKGGGYTLYRDVVPDDGTVVQALETGSEEA